MCSGATTLHCRGRTPSWLSLIPESGLDWCTSAVKESIEELVELSTGERATSACDESIRRFADT